MPIYSHNRWFIIVTLVIAIISEVIPYPDLVMLYRPQWLAMTLIFWCLYLPTAMGVLRVWLLGLLIEVLLGTLLGQHGIGYVLIALVCLKTHRRLVLLPLIQQSILVFCLLVIERIPAFWIMGMLESPPPLLSYWLTPLISAIIWLWLVIILRDLKRYFHVT